MDPILHHTKKTSALLIVSLVNWLQSAPWDNLKSNYIDIFF